MKKEFVLPEKWKLIWDCYQTYKISLGYCKISWAYYHNSGFTSDKQYISFADKPDKWNEYIRITPEQYVQYVLKQKPIKPKKDDYKPLIKLLKNLNLT